MATSSTTTIRCMACHSDHSRPGTTYVNELLYPLPVCSLIASYIRPRLTRFQKLMTRNARTPKPTFSHILKSSIERETTSRGWCNRCTRYQSLATKKTIHSAPAVLLLNAAINSAEAKALWATPGWLPEEIGIIINEGQFFCFQGEEIKMHLSRRAHNITIYSLVGLVVEIDSGQHQKSHLVSLVNGKWSSILKLPC